MKSRIMFIEKKAGAIVGEARIGRVTFSKSGQTIYYGAQTFHRIKGGAFKSNYYDEASGDDYWISGPKKRGGDRLYSSPIPVHIDEDVRVEYWLTIRELPQNVERDSSV